MILCADAEGNKVEVPDDFLMWAAELGYFTYPDNVMLVGGPYFMLAGKLGTIILSPTKMYFIRHDGLFAPRGIGSIPQSKEELAGAILAELM